MKRLIDYNTLKPHHEITEFEIGVSEILLHSVWVR